MAEGYGRMTATRRRLAMELVRLRDQAGLSGREMARQIGISQSKVSRIEAGTTMPTLPEVTAWAEAVGTTVEMSTELRSLTEAAFTEIHRWRSLLRDRPHLQDQIGRREAAAGRVRAFQPSIVPGLLQTADYAARVFSMSQLPYAEGDAAAAVAGRLRRQAALDDGGRFEFLLTESALRWSPGPRHLMLAQLERIVLLSTIAPVSVGVIPACAAPATAIPHGFVIYGEDDSAHVTIETIHANVEVYQPTDVALYENQWTLLCRMAIVDDAAREFVVALAADLRGGDA
jgi:transcriptional regulator with XRE-family HTH domain